MDTWEEVKEYRCGLMDQYSDGFITLGQMVSKMFPVEEATNEMVRRLLEAQVSFAKYEGFLRASKE